MMNQFLHRLFWLVLCFSSVPVYAVTLNNETIANLGIHTQAPLSMPGQAQVLPAQVIVPQQSQQNISLSHSVTLVAWLIDPYQRIEAQQPLAKLFSSTLLDAAHSLLIARNQAKLAQQQWQREQTLYQQGLVPKKRLDMAQTERDNAEVTAKMAAQQCLHLGMSEAQIQQMEKTGIPTGEFLLRAKVKGRVVKLDAIQGHSITPGEPLLSYQSGDERWLSFSLTPQEVQPFSTGETFHIVDTTYEAELVGQQPERNTAQKVVFLAKVRNAPELMPGQWVKLSLNHVQASVYEVPRSALIHINNQPTLFVIENNQVVSLPVVVLGATRGGWQVSSRLLNVDSAVVVQGGAAIKAMLESEPAALGQDGNNAK
ncbi:MAG: efflux RND transporter periplasmic adaptor subunit [Thiotrichales bacterium]|jgi:multidrug efflux pump subunit AcrA (membrane-fusion protein)|nr:efflux RND transporter periplasmic adaptor subunit [Thiotrichales bacterium]